MNNYFDAIPGTFCPVFGSLEYRIQLKSSLLSYITNIEKSLNIELTHTRKLVDSLDLNKKFAPGVFACYALIIDAYALNDVQALFDGVQMLHNIAKQSLYCNNIQFSTIMTDIWEYSFVNNLRSPTMIDDYGKEINDDCKMVPLCHWNDNEFPPAELKEALNLLKDIDQYIYNEYLNYVASVKLFSAKIIQGATSPRFFGNIFLRIPYRDEDPIIFYLEHIVHEVSHLQLYAMMQVDKIILNNETELFSSPLREDKRPMIGVFHSVFVLSRIVRVLQMYLESHPQHNFAMKMLSKVTDQFKYGYNVVDEFGKLTEKGNEIKNSFHRCALLT